MADNLEGYAVIQSGEMGWWEPHEVQRVEVKSPTLREEQFHAPVSAGGQLAKKQLCKKDLGALLDNKLNMG